MFSVFSRPGYIKGLDGLRAISVAFVMIGHYGFEKVVPGGLGVTIFFFISGFLITTLLITENDRTGTIGVKDFYVRRFLRLAPELYPLIIITGVLGVFYGHPAKPLDYASGFLYFTNYIFAFSHAHGEAAASGLRWQQLWSLAVEEHFYLTFPLLILLMRNKLRHLMLVLSVVCVASLTWRFIAHHIGLGDIYTYAASECRIDSIAYGCITAIAFSLYGARYQRHATAALIGLAAGLAVMLGCLVVRNDTFRETLRYSLQGLALVAIFGGLFFSPIGERLRNILELPPLRWMGRRSYGAYLWHPEFLLLWIWFGHWDPDHERLVAKLIFIVVGFALTFAVSEISYRIFLRPAQALRRRFGSHTA